MKAKGKTVGRMRHKTAGQEGMKHGSSLSQYMMEDNKYVGEKKTVGKMGEQKRLKIY